MSVLGHGLEGFSIMPVWSQMRLKVGRVSTYRPALDAFPTLGRHNFDMPTKDMAQPLNPNHSMHDCRCLSCHGRMQLGKR